MHGGHLGTEIFRHLRGMLAGLLLVAISTPASAQEDEAWQDASFQVYADKCLYGRALDSEQAEREWQELRSVGLDGELIFDLVRGMDKPCLGGGFKQDVLDSHYLGLGEEDRLSESALRKLSQARNAPVGFRGLPDKYHCNYRFGMATLLGVGLHSVAAAVLFGIAADQCGCDARDPNSCGWGNGLCWVTFTPALIVDGALGLFCLVASIASADVVESNRIEIEMTNDSNRSFRREVRFSISPSGFSLRF